MTSGREGAWELLGDNVGWGTSGWAGPPRGLWEEMHAPQDGDIAGHGGSRDTLPEH